MFLDLVMCGDFIVANIQDEYSAFLWFSETPELTVAVDKTSFYLFSYFSFSLKAFGVPSRVLCG